MKTLELIDFISANSDLTKDVDLFYLDIPLATSGLWIQDSSVPSRFNGVDTTQYEVYVRAKNKETVVANIGYFKSWVETNELCLLPDDTAFRLTIDNNWDYLEKDSEGYHVFTSTLTLII